MGGREGRLRDDFDGEVRLDAVAPRGDLES